MGYLLERKKSRLMFFGKRMNTSPDISLNGRKIDWATEWSYLGVALKSGTSFNCSVTERVRKFYRSSNAIFRIEGRSNDTVMLQRVPILTYAIEVVHVANRDERRQL